MNFSIKGIFVASSLGFIASTAAAQQQLTCAEANGSVLSGWYDVKTTSLYGNGVDMQLEVGDVVSVTLNEGLAEPISEQSRTDIAVLAPPVAMITFATPSSKARVTVPFSHTVSEAGGHYVGGLSLVLMGYRNGETAAIPIVSATVSCVPAGGGASTLQFAAAGRQNSTILNGLNQAAGGRNGDGGVQATQAGLSFNTGNTGEWYVWGYTQWQSYSDAGTGTSAGAVVGADRDVGGARVGVVLAYDDTSIDFGSGDESVRSFAVGPYVTGSYDGIDYDAYLTYARPDYDTPSGSYESERVSFGIAVDGNVAMANGANLSPFLRFSGASEDVPVVGVNPADTITTNQVALGARYDFATMQSGFAPYLSLAYEANRQDSTAGGEVTYQAARYGVGFEYETNGGGTIHFDLSAGESGVDLRDVGVRLGYSTSF